MAKIEVGQFSSLLRRYLGMKGVSDVVDELSPEISPAFVLESERPEWEFLKGARLMAHATQTGATVGQNSAWRLRNPATSGVIGILTYLNAGPNTNNGLITVTFGAQAADQATTSGTTPRDGRMIPPTGGALIASFGVAALGGTACDMAALLGTTTFQFLRGSAIVISPGFAVNVGCSTVNTDVVVAAHWLEKRLDDLEAR